MNAQINNLKFINIDEGTNFVLMMRKYNDMNDEKT